MSSPVIEENLKNITIRSEKWQDYNRIAEITDLAFYAMIDATQNNSWH